MQKTGTTVKERGLFSSECCENEQIFEVGDNFTRCPKCMSLTKWEMHDELVTVDEFEQINGIAA